MILDSCAKRKISYERPSVRPLVFLAFESPWPPYSGAQKRVLGLLSELALAYPIDLRLLTREPLSRQQGQELARYAQDIREIPRRDKMLRDRLAVAIRAARQCIPYHAALVEHSFALCEKAKALRPRLDDCVYANSLHWTLPLTKARTPTWIVDQQNADVHFWQVYARHSTDPLVRLVASINARLTHRLCTQVYPNTAAIVSVCSEDKELTRSLCQVNRVDVIANGVDCDFFSPNRTGNPGNTLLFTGTSAARNMNALRYFVRQVYPLVRAQVPDVSLVIGGNFARPAQDELAQVPAVSFTGRVPDLRPAYNNSAVLINPFQEAYGSKLKVSEALAMGICIISSRAGCRGLPVRDGESVLFADDPRGMAHQIVRALTDRQLAERIGRAGRELAVTHLDWRRVLGPRVRQLVGEVLYGG